MKLFIIVFLFLFIFHQGFSQSDYLRFNKITADNGLVNNSVNVIFKDRQGFIWFGNGNGLFRYDSYAIKNFQNDPNDSTSLGSNKVENIIEDIAGNLWIATKKGLDKFIVREGRFEHILKDKPYLRICFDNDSNIWLANQYGIAIYSPKTGKLTELYHKDNDENTLPEGGVMALVKDPKGNIWFCIWNHGIYCYDAKKKSFKNYVHKEGDSSSLFKNSVFTICPDKNDGIWVGSLNESGVARLDINTGKFTHIPPLNKNTPFQIFTMSVDVYGNIWMGSLSNGLFKYEYKTGKITQYLHDHSDIYSLAESKVVRLYCDYEGVLWIATVNAGVSYTQIYKNNIKLYPLKFSDRAHFPIQNIYEDIKGRVWFTTNKEIYFLDNQKAQIMTIPHAGLKHGEIKLLKYFNKYKLLLITKADSAIVDLKQRTCKRFDFKPFIGISGAYDVIINEPNLKIWRIDSNLYFSNSSFKNGKLLLTKQPINNYDFFIGSRVIKNFMGGDDHLIFFSGGLYLINPYSREIKPLLENLKNNAGANDIKGVYVNGDTLEIFIKNELLLYNIRNRSIKYLSPNNLTKEDIVTKPFKLDNKKFCYITYRGLIVADFQNKIFCRPDIFINGILHPDHVYQLRTGGVMAEVMQGIVYFNPDIFFETAGKIPKFSITDFYLFNQKVPIGPKSVLKEDPSRLKSVTLSHNEKVFSFEFSLLSFNNEFKQYRYKLEGYENDWNYIGERKVATYTNLDPGSYRFKASGTTENSAVSEDVNIEVVILPAFWQTLWFRLLILFLIIILIYSFVYLRFRIIRKQKEELEIKVKQRTEEISKQNLEILAQKEELVQKNDQISELYQELTDNIHTAKRIQDALLPGLELIRNSIPNSFVFFSPKDIVSGDFYWFIEKAGKIYLAAVDCTGHGVSGAFMSLIGRTLLNQIVADHPLYNAGELLTALSKELTFTLKQDSDEAITKDGMDIALVIINKGVKEIDYAGANNPLFIVKNGEIEIIKADKTGIGLQRGNVEAVFKSNLVGIDPDADYYIFSDGFIGQFGGENGEEKFKMNRFKELLLQSSGVACKEREYFFKNSLKNWKQYVPQTDDILVIGLNFK